MSDDDFVTIATYFDPTEARLLQGALQAAGVDAIVGDGNTVQTDQLLAIAVRVRVRVPASQVEAARQAMKALDEGAFALDGENASPAKPASMPQPAPLFGPDAAALWSLVLTPLFGTALMLVNAWRDPQAVDRATATAWVVAAAAALAGAIAFSLTAGHAGAWSLARIGLAFLTVVWYVAVAQPLSKRVIRRYGAMYRRAPTMALGWALLAMGVAGRWIVGQVG